MAAAHPRTIALHLPSVAATERLLAFAVPLAARFGAKLIGVGWSMQRLNDTVPADPWDIPLDAFASPDGLEWFERSGRAN